MSWVGIDFVPFDCTKNHVKLVFEVIPAQAQLLVQFLLGTAVGIKHINIISGRRIVRVKQKLFNSYWQYTYRSLTRIQRE